VPRGPGVEPSGLGDLGGPTLGIKSNLDGEESLLGGLCWCPCRRGPAVCSEPLNNTPSSLATPKSSNPLLSVLLPSAEMGAGSPASVRCGDLDRKTRGPSVSQGRNRGDIAAFGSSSPASIRCGDRDLPRVERAGRRRGT